MSRDKTESRQSTKMLRLSFNVRCMEVMMTIKLIIRSKTTETPLKMMENAFYFTLKALFVLKIFKFLSSLLSHAEKLT